MNDQGPVGVVPVLPMDDHRADPAAVEESLQRELRLYEQRARRHVLPMPCAEHFADEVRHGRMDAEGVPERVVP